MPSTKIAVITPAKFPGVAGDTANYSEIMNELVSEGFSVSLICPKNQDHQRGNQGLPNKVEVIRIPSNPPRLLEMNDKPSLRNYLSAVLFMIIESLTVLWVLKRRGIKHVFMRHSLLTMQIPILLKILNARTAADGEIASDYFEKTGMNAAVLRFIKSIERKAINCYSLFKVSSESQAQNLSGIGFPKSKVLIVPVSINPEKIPKHSISEIPKHTFGYFGVLERWQGVDLLLQAFQILITRLPDAKLYIIGEGSLKEDLQRIVKQNKLSANVLITGGMPRDKLWNEYFRRFRVIVIPRPKQNNSMDFVLPIKLIESMAAGKPIIAIDIPIMKEIPNNPIFSVKSPDPNLMAEAMEKLSIDENLLAKHSAASLSAASNYDIRNHMSALVRNLIGE